MPGEARFQRNRAFAGCLFNPKRKHARGGRVRFLRFASISRALGAVLDGRGGFALAGAEVVEFCAAHGTPALDLDLGDAGRMQRKDTLDPLAVGNTANGEVRVDAGPLSANHNTRVDLDPLLVAFDDAGVDFDGVADGETTGFRLELFGFDF
jgi:hypothetical protein